MKTRIISGLVMAPLLIVLYLGGWWIWAAELLIAVMGLQEFYNGWNNLDVHPSREIGYIMTVLLFVTAVPYNTGNAPSLPKYYENMMVICIWLFLAVAAGVIYGWKINVRGPYDSLARVTGLVDNTVFHSHMDLIIRTSGEERISNFLTWQSAYSELMFTDTLWPDFTPEEYAEMIKAYAERDRRFGGRKEAEKK